MIKPWMFIPNNLPTAGQQSYTSPGTYSWTCPEGVTKVSVVVVGGYYYANGGSLAYKNDISVTPGNSYTVFIDTATGFTGTNNPTYFIDASTVAASIGSGSIVGDGGGAGGAASTTGGGAAGGYAGAGGGGRATYPSAGVSGSGGAGGSGGASSTYCGGGGGVGLNGQGSSGAGGTTSGTGGRGGSGGNNGSNGTTGTDGNGGAYGGAGGCLVSAGSGSPGAVRIIWPGDVRQFPSTRTTDE